MNLRRCNEKGLARGSPPVRAIGQPRSNPYCASRKDPRCDLRQRMRGIANTRVRYRSRRVHSLLKGEGLVDVFTPPGSGSRRPRRQGSRRPTIGSTGTWWAASGLMGRLSAGSAGRSWRPSTPVHSHRAGAWARGGRDRGPPGLTRKRFERTPAFSATLCGRRSQRIVDAGVPQHCKRARPQTACLEKGRLRTLASHQPSGGRLMQTDCCHSGLPRRRSAAAKGGSALRPSAVQVRSREG
jgi:hypothetical protein